MRLYKHWLDHDVAALAFLIVGMTCSATSSAMASAPGAMVRPSAFAVRCSQRIAVGATVEPVAPCSFSGCMTNANS